MGFNCDIFPPWGLQGKDGSYFSLHVYIPLHCYTVVQFFKVVCKQYRSYCKHLHMYRCVYSINNKGQIRWDVKNCIAGNFREAEIFVIFAIKNQVAKFLPMKISSRENFFLRKFLADKSRKLSALPSSLISRDSIDPNLLYKHSPNCEIFWGDSDLRSTRLSLVTLMNVMMDTPPPGLTSF